MRFLQAERECCNRLIPGLLDKLSSIPLPELEQPKSPAIGLFRDCGASNLLVPKEYGGIGASALEAARVVRALGAAAPSMTVATAMHHFSIGTLFGLADVFADSDLDGLLLTRVAEERMLVASGFAEGKSGQGILTPTVLAEPDPSGSGWRITGAKKPCSLSESMDLLTASVGVPRADGGVDMGFLLLPADTEGISVHPFWSSFALAGAESNEVRLTDVQVTDRQILLPPEEMAEQLSQLQEVGLIWFQLIVTAAYTGMVSRLVDVIHERGRGTDRERAALTLRIEAVAQLAEGLARRVDAGDTDSDGVAAALATRFEAQDRLRSISGDALELLGGMSFVSSPDVAYLAAASQAIAFHPPSRSSTLEPLAAYYAGQPLVIG